MNAEADGIGFERFGLDGPFPHPGWVVLDAARQHGYTGELLFETVASHEATLLAVTHDHELLPQFDRVVDFNDFRVGSA